MYEGDFTEVLNVVSFKDTLCTVNRSKSNSDSFKITYHTPLVLTATGVQPVIRNRTSSKKNGKVVKYLIDYWVKCKDSHCCKKKQDTCSKVSFKSKSVTFNTEAERENAKQSLLKGELDENWVEEKETFEFTLEERRSICTKNGQIRAKLFKVPRPVRNDKSENLPIEPYFLG